MATPEGEREVAFHRSRAGAVANALLGPDCSGVLVSDFYGGDNDTPGGWHQRCWGHLLRGRARAGRGACGRDRTGREREGARLLDGGGARRLAPAASGHAPPHPTHPPPWSSAREQRQAHAGRLRLALQALGAQFVTALDHPCRARAWRRWHFQHELRTCVIHPGVPADNNAAAPAIRPLVVGRTISGGTRSPRGSRTHTGRYSLAATWTAQGRHPLAEFRHLLQSPFPQV